VPLLFVLIFGPNFINTLSFTGSVVAGMFGLLICIAIIFERKKLKKTKSKVYFTVPGGSFLPIITGIFFLIGILVTLFY
jgi:multisubunit Na+/H+ antiporter MnhB subunit